MGCSTCTTKGGCDERKGEERIVLADVVRRVYPDLTWGRPDDEARFRAGVPRREVRRHGRAIAELLKAPTYFREGAADDLCDHIYVLCLGREPALVEVRDGLARFDGSEVETVRERYLRASFSSVARLAAVQEIDMTLTREGDTAVIVEAPRAGVYEESLLKRMRNLTAYLTASEMTYCDFGLLDKPVAQALKDETFATRAGDYVERWGVEPRLANFLFYEQPPTTSSTTTIAI